MDIKIKKKKLNREETDILATLMLKEAFDKEVVYVHVKIGKHLVMLTVDEFKNIYIPKIENKK